MATYKPTTKLGKGIDLMLQTITQPQADRLIALGIEAALLLGDALVTELRGRYFAKHPDRQWIVDPTTIEVE